MSTLEDLDDLERESRDKKQDQGDGDGKKRGGDGDAEMEDAEKKNEEEDLLDEEILHSSTADIVKRRRMLENEMRIMKSEFQRLTHEQSTMREKVKDNQEKIENNRYGFNDTGMVLGGLLQMSAELKSQECIRKSIFVQC